jgi:hypothetical protein
MMIIGCDFHPSWQQIAWLDSETGETGEQKLVHASGDAKSFYARLGLLSYRGAPSRLALGPIAWATCLEAPISEGSTGNCVEKRSGVYCQSNRGAKMEIPIQFWHSVKHILIRRNTP